jgi:hypothetical protein
VVFCSAGPSNRISSHRFSLPGRSLHVVRPFPNAAALAFIERLQSFLALCFGKPLIERACPILSQCLTSRPQMQSHLGLGTASTRTNFAYGQRAPDLAIRCICCGLLIRPGSASLSDSAPDPDFPRGSLALGQFDSSTVSGKIVHGLYWGRLAGRPLKLHTLVSFKRQSAGVVGNHRRPTILM